LADDGYRRGVGFNPFREHEKTTLDVVIVVFAVVAILAVIAWAVLSV
jgi:hypothetical protein